MEAEKFKADLELIEKQKEEEKAMIFEVNKAKEKEKRDQLKDALTPEPQSGNVINIAIRLPNGSRLIRNFRQEEPVKVNPGHLVHPSLHLLKGRVST